MSCFFFSGREYEDFGQDAFNRYALEIGEPVMNDIGLFTHGSGYEWQTVFEKAFESDPESGKIQYDCEAGGFFCYAESLSLLEDFGTRFRVVCMDGEKLAEPVSISLKDAAEKEIGKEYCANHDCVFTEDGIIARKENGQVMEAVQSQAMQM